MHETFKIPRADWIACLLPTVEEEGWGGRWPWFSGLHIIVSSVGRWGQRSKLFLRRFLNAPQINHYYRSHCKRRQFKKSFSVVAGEVNWAASAIIVPAFSLLWPFTHAKCFWHKFSFRFLTPSSTSPHKCALPTRWINRKSRSLQPPVKIKASGWMRKAFSMTTRCGCHSISFCGTVISSRANEIDLISENYYLWERHHGNVGAWWGESIWGCSLETVMRLSLWCWKVRRQGRVAR